ncbi:hypothetical protein BS50DRAFT_577204 [Corynespora cassiicola Philippines]|uniref:Uncharacterized protein n=1 Tax=Corynespora cassiicola Philippines TaxID=1448308 RepID=A0A2T2NDE0_CORCC|nr:hypothetical protein BS50DRAFT_577204 [Corynespora cassiicola Philippines]
MAELEISRKYDPPSPAAGDSGSESGDRKAGVEKVNMSADKLRPENGPENDDGAGEGGLSLPSAPTSLPNIPADDLKKTQDLEDALTARLAALSSPASDSLGLPSAPSFPPAKKPPKIQSSLAKFTDEEIETWCIICSDDATLKCIGCDGDLYCQKCWMEGHKGEAAGMEERRHRAVLYNKDGGEDGRKKVAAG